MIHSLVSIRFTPPSNSLASSDFQLLLSRNGLAIVGLFASGLRPALAWLTSTKQGSGAFPRTKSDKDDA